MMLNYKVIKKEEEKDPNNPLSEVRQHGRTQILKSQYCSFGSKISPLPKCYK